MLYFLLACVAFTAGIILGEWSERRETRIREAKAKAAELLEAERVDVMAMSLGIPRKPGETTEQLRARVQFLSYGRGFTERELVEMVATLPPDMRPAWWPPSPREG